MTPEGGKRVTEEIVRRLFGLLGEELGAAGVEGEPCLVGGAVMCLAFDARPATRDVDALFRPAREIREAAARVAARAGVPRGWLNDAVKGFLDERGDFDPFLELPNLRVFIARPEYLLAMKCASMRPRVQSNTYRSLEGSSSTPAFDPGQFHCTSYRFTRCSSHSPAITPYTRPSATM